MQDLETKAEEKIGSTFETLNTNPNNGQKVEEVIENGLSRKSSPIKAIKTDESDVICRKYLIQLNKSLRKNWSADTTNDGRIYYIK